MSRYASQPFRSIICLCKSGFDVGNKSMAPITTWYFPNRPSINEAQTSFLPSWRLTKIVSTILRFRLAFRSWNVPHLIRRVILTYYVLVLQTLKHSLCRIYATWRCRKQSASVPKVRRRCHWLRDQEGCLQTPCFLLTKHEARELTRGQ